MNLTEHFTREEMLRSDAAVRLDIAEQFVPEQDIIDNLTSLCKNVLEPLREKSGMAIHISSGYRCYSVNHAIGGAINSQHTKGQAADTQAPGTTIEAWYQFIKASGIVFDQLIQEFDSWVHISYNATGPNRIQCLRAIKEKGKTVYKQD